MPDAPGGRPRRAGAVPDLRDGARAPRRDARRQESRVGRHDAAVLGVACVRQSGGSNPSASRRRAANAENEPAIYPVLFRIGEFEITSFGVLVAIGALVGLWLFRRELRRSGLSDHGIEAAIAGIIGGMAGAKLLWVFEHLGEEPTVDLLLSRRGVSWFGGFAGSVLAGLVVMQWKGLTRVPVPM
jgi:hypothetical protein